MVDSGHGVGEMKNGVYLDFKDAIARLGKDKIRERYGNLFAMYEKITGEDPYNVPMRIYPAPHYTMGGLWVDYNLQTTVPGLFAAGEANFSDHGANRLGASALMQGMADGYFILPLTIGDWLARVKPGDTSTDHAAFKDAERAVKEKVDSLLAVGGKTTVDTFHMKLGEIMWDNCGMTRNAEGLKAAIRKDRGAPGGVLEGCPGPWKRRILEPVAGEGGTRGRLPGVRRGDVLRRPGPGRVLRRPLP